MFLCYYSVYEKTEPFQQPFDSTDCFEVMILKNKVLYTFKINNNVILVYLVCG